MTSGICTATALACLCVSGQDSKQHMPYAAWQPRILPANPSMGWVSV